MINAALMIAALAAVETGGSVHTGRAGEVGPCQMTPAVVRAFHTPARYIEYIERELEAHRIEVTPRTVALCWNGGVSAVCGRCIHPATWNYSIRVQNIYDSLNK